MAITDESLGLRPGDMIRFKAIEADDPEYGSGTMIPPQRAEYLGDGEFDVIREDRLPGEEHDGRCECGEPGLLEVISRATEVT